MTITPSHLTSLPSSVVLIENDRGPEELIFLKNLCHAIKKDSGAREIRLVPICAVSAERICLSPRMREYIKAAGYTEEQAITLFQSSLKKHLDHLPATVKAPEKPILLISLSNVEISPGQEILEMPGMLYHQDGGGKVIATEITMVGDPDSWEGGSLDILDPSIRTHHLALGHFSEYAKKKPQEVGYTCQVRPKNGDTVIFDNKQVWHAVEAPLRACKGVKTERTIYQLRLNDATQLSEELLKEYC